MAKKSNGTTGGSGGGLSAEIEVITSVDQGTPGNRLAVITELLVFVDGRLVKVKRGHVRTLDIPIGDAPASAAEKTIKAAPAPKASPAKPAKSTR